MEKEVETKGTVLLIDDNILPMRYYIWALEEKGFEVIQLYGTDATFKFLEEKKPNPVAIILDIMMLPGKKYQDKDTNGGLKTGLLLYEDLRKLYPSIPIIVLTNVSDPKILNTFSEVPRLRLVQKLDYPPFELTELVIEMINLKA